MKSCFTISARDACLVLQKYLACPAPWQSSLSTPVHFASPAGASIISALSTCRWFLHSLLLLCFCICAFQGCERQTVFAFQTSLYCPLWACIRLKWCVGLPYIFGARVIIFKFSFFMNRVLRVWSLFPRKIRGWFSEFIFCHKFGVFRIFCILSSAKKIMFEYGNKKDKTTETFLCHSQYLQRVTLVEKFNSGYTYNSLCIYSHALQCWRPSCR